MVDLSGIERALLVGDLSQLSEEQRLIYYRRVCESLGLNPLTRPFDYLRLNGKLVLYANRSCAEQLRQIHGISIEIVSQEFRDDCFVVRVRARTRDGRVDEDLGIVPIRGLQGEALANQILKAITKAKRRVTLSIAGLGWLDETEVEAIPGAERVPVAPLEEQETAALTAAPSNEAGEQAQEEHEAATVQGEMDERAQRGLAWIASVCAEHQVPVSWAMQWLSAQGIATVSQLDREGYRRLGRAIREEGIRRRAMAERS